VGLQPLAECHITTQQLGAHLQTREILALLNALDRCSDLRFRDVLCHDVSPSLLLFKSPIDLRLATRQT
jgi:hypothetical protein